MYILSKVNRRGVPLISVLDPCNFDDAVDDYRFELFSADTMIRTDLRELSNKLADKK